MRFSATSRARPASRRGVTRCCAAAWHLPRPMMFRDEGLQHADESVAEVEVLNEPTSLVWLVAAQLVLFAAGWFLTSLALREQRIRSPRCRRVRRRSLVNRAFSRRAAVARHQTRAAAVADGTLKADTRERLGL